MKYFVTIDSILTKKTGTRVASLGRWIFALTCFPVGLNIIIAFAFVKLNNVSFVHAKNTSATKKSKGNKDKKYRNNGKKSKHKNQKFAKTRSGKAFPNNKYQKAKVKGQKIKIMSLTEMAQLEFWNRASYIDTIRETYATLADLQQDFKLKGFAKHIHPSEKQNEYWARVLIAPRANAVSPAFSVMAEQSDHPMSYARGPASASGGTKEFGRGLNPTSVDHCIYAMSLQNYQQVKRSKSGTKAAYNKTRAFYCQRPVCTNTKCVGSGRPTKCGFLGSGLTGEDRCLSCSSSNVNSSVSCFSKGQKALCKFKGGNDTKAVNSCQACANIAGGRSNVAQCYTKKQAEMGNKPDDAFNKLIWNHGGKEAEDRVCDDGRIRNLFQHAYSSLAMAELIYVIHHRQTNAKSCQGKALPNIPELADFSQQWEKQGDIVDQVFQKFVNHCQQKLNKNTIKELQQVGSGNKKYKEKSWTRREKVRAKSLKEVLAKGEAPTVGNVIQVASCDKVESKYKKLVASFKDIEKGKTPIEEKVSEDKVIAEQVVAGPAIVDDNSTTDGGDSILDQDTAIKENPKVIVTSERGPTKKVIAIKKPINQKKKFTYRGTGIRDLKPSNSPQRLGCRQDRNFALHGTNSQRGMQCVRCATENMVKRSTNNSKYKMSSRWQQLLTVMSTQCGVTRSFGSDGEVSDLTAGLAFKITESLGHCDQSTYGWNSYGGDPPGYNWTDLDLVTVDELKEKPKNGGRPISRQQWWTRGYVGKNYDPDKKEEFRKVFGLTFQTAKEVFGCTDNRTITSANNSDENVDRPPLQSLEVMQSNFFTNIDKIDNTLLKQCAIDAKESVAKYYGGSPNGQCAKSESFGNGRAANRKRITQLLEKAVEPVKQNGGGQSYRGMVIDTKNRAHQVSCFVAKAHTAKGKGETYRKGNVTFLAPEAEEPDESELQENSYRRQRKKHGKDGKVYHTPSRLDRMALHWDLDKAAPVDSSGVAARHGYRDESGMGSKLSSGKIKIISFESPCKPVGNNPDSSNTTN